MSVAQSKTPYPQSKRKIAYIITRGGIGGAQAHVAELLNHFRQAYEPLLITGSDGYLASEAQLLGIRTYVVEELDSFHAITAVLRLRKIIASEQPDLVHVHSALASFYGRLAAKLCGKKTVYTVHGWHFFDEPSRLSEWLKIAVERGYKPFTDYWITVSKFDHRVGLDKGLIKSSRGCAIANGIAPLQTNPDPKRPAKSDEFKLIFIGRAARQKNVGSAIKVLEGTTQNVRLTAYLSGLNSNDEIDALVNASPASDRTQVHLNNPDAAQALTQHSALLMTSRYEGMPLAALEAMRAGLPIVATNVCGMSEIIEHQVTGFLLPPEQEHELAEAINRLATDPVLASKLGSAARQKYESEFQLENMLRSVADVYESLFEPRDT